MIWFLPFSGLCVFKTTLCLQDATEMFTFSLLRTWAEAGLLRSSGRSLSVPSDHQPLPVRIQHSADSSPLYYLSHIEESRLAQLPEHTWKGPTYLVASREEATDVVDRILQKAEGDPRERVLGFDLECKPRYSALQPKSPPTVIQAWIFYFRPCVCIIKGFWLRYGFMTFHDFKQHVKVAVWDIVAEFAVGSTPHPSAVVSMTHY
jgi:hypothetical protein